MKPDFSLLLVLLTGLTGLIWLIDSLFLRRRRLDRRAGSSAVASASTRQMSARWDFPAPPGPQSAAQPNGQSRQPSIRRSAARLLSAERRTRALNLNTRSQMVSCLMNWYREMDR